MVKQIFLGWCWTSLEGGGGARHHYVGGGHTPLHLTVDLPLINFTFFLAVNNNGITIKW